MAVVRLEAMRALQKAIVDAVPEFGDGQMHVVISQAPPNKKLCLPSLVIDPVRFRYLPDQESEHFEPDPARLVLNVGRHEATVQLRLAAATPFERYELQDKLVDLFLRTEGHPGVLMTPVSACPALGEFLASWEMDEDEWQDEKVFDVQYWGMVTLTGVIPALVTRGVHRMEDIRLGLTGDFETAFGSANVAASSSTVEVVRINEDGTFTTL